MGGHANARVRGFLHSTTRYMYLEHGCTRFCAGGGRWPGRRNEKSPKYVPNKEIRYKMRAHAQRASGANGLSRPFIGSHGSHTTALLQLLEASAASRATKATSSCVGTAPIVSAMVDLASIRSLI